MAMKISFGILWIFGLQLLSIAGYAQPIDVNSLTYFTGLHRMRLMFEVTSSPKHRVFVLDNPSRLVIDIKNAHLGHALNQPSVSHPLFSKVRAAPKSNTDLRVVVDLKRPVDAKTFSLNSNNKDEHRLIIDLTGKAAISAKNEDKPRVKPDGLKAMTDTVISIKTAESADNSKIVEPKKIVRKSVKAGAQNLREGKTGLKKAAHTTKSPAIRPRSVVVAIDAGHGGDDPGAQGPNGTEEKKVTFAIAKKLAALINAQPGMKAVMIRKGDYYVGLRNRMQIARAAKADLFISIHADAFQDAGVKGASVYTLSRGGASNEAARWLAKRENSADLIGGVSLVDKEDVLASVLLDLSQTATEEASLQVARNVLKNFQSVCDIHKDSVQKAEFLVLKSPDIPSILVETAFISNPSEELNLQSSRYQLKLASAIFKGVHNYFKQSPMIDSKMAAL
jgi:N-acetylmuramoyl-L-alanine amidase